MAFRRGDEGEMGQLGALLLADGLRSVSAMLKAYHEVHKA